MKKIIVLLIATFTSLSCGGQKKDDSQLIGKEKIIEIEKYINAQSKLQKIPGLAVAIIKDGTTIYKGYFGKTEIEKDELVSKNTLFPIYSVSKLMTSVAIFQLIEDGKIQLTDSISTYFVNLPESWKKIQIKNLLTHSSGLPDLWTPELRPQLKTISDKELFSQLFTKEMVFTAGNHWEYNQTNFWLLSMIIAKVTGNSFEDFVLQNQFSTEEKNTLFSSDMSQKIKHKAFFHSFNPLLQKYQIDTTNNPGSKLHSANGLVVSLDALINWNRRLDENSMLDRQTKLKMWEPFAFSNENNSFLHGWDVYSINDHEVYGFSGGACSAFRKFPKNDLTIILLSNGYRYYSVESTMIDHIAGIIDERLKNEYQLFEENLASILITDNPLVNYKEFRIKHENEDLEFSLNSVGTMFMRNGLFDKAAIAYGLNVKENPKSVDYLNRLAAAYYYNQQYKSAVSTYNKVLEIIPENSEAKEMIEKIDKMEN